MRRLALAALVAIGCGSGAAKAPAPRPAATGEELGPPARPEDLKGNLVAIEVVGMSADRAARAREGVSKAIGKPYGAGQVAAAIRFVSALSGVADVAAEARPLRGGVAVRLVVVEHPRMRSIDVRGSHAVPASEWLGRMGIKAGDFVDPVLLTARRQDMVETLRSFGHVSAQVVWSAEKAPDGKVDVVFTVEEGPAVVLSKIDIRGNKAVKRDKLLEILAKNGGTTVGARYWRDALGNALLHLSSLYYDLGYINVQIDDPKETLSADKSAMTIVLAIREGDRYRLGKLDAKGALVAPVSEYVKLLGVKKGEVFNRSKLAAGLERINEMHQKKGNPALQTSPATVIDAVKHTVGITVEVMAPAK